MGRGSAVPDPGLDERLDALEARIAKLEELTRARLTPAPDDALEERLRTLEARLSIESPADTYEEPAAPATPEVSIADLFVKLAILCFVLVGALVLRVAALDGTLNARTGTLLGLVYCAALVGASAWTRPWPRLRGQVLLLEVAGAVLAPMVVLESFHKTGVLGLPVAIALLTGVAVAAAAVAAARPERVLANVALAVGVMALFGLGFATDALPWRTGATTFLVGAALVIAHRRNWPELRLLTVGPVLAAGGTGAVMLSTRPGMPAAAAPTLLVASTAVLALVAVSHGVRRARVTRLESVWLPVTALWAQGLYLHHSVELGAAAGAVATVLALGLAAASLRRSGAETDSPPPAAALGTASLVATGSLLAVASLPWVEPTGVAAGFASLVVLSQSVRLRSAWLGALAELVAASAVLPVVRAVAGDAGPSLWILGPGMLATGALLLVHFTRARAAAPSFATDDPDAIAPRLGYVLAPAALAFAAACLFGGLRALILAVLGDGAGADLGQTIVIAALATLGLRIGRGRGIQQLRVAGFVGVLVLAAKVLLHDLPALGGTAKIASVVLLGAMSLLASLSVARSTSGGGRPG